MLFESVVPKLAKASLAGLPAIRQMEVGLLLSVRFGSASLCVAFVMLLMVAGCVSGAADRPSLIVPAFIGVRYSAEVPDTLDLAERMRLSLHGITNCVGGPPANPFPRTQYLCNHFIDVRPFPPKVLRNINLYGKYMLGALLARTVTGSDENLHIDNDWRSGLLDFQQIDPVMTGPEGGRWLEWIAFNIRRESEPNRSAWVALAKHAVARLNEAAVTYKDGAWMPYGDSPQDDGFVSVHAKRDRTIKTDKNWRPTGFYASGDAWTVQGLCAIYRTTKDAAVLKLARRLVRYQKNYGEMIAPDGHLLSEVPPGATHWHHSFQAAQACAEFGAIAQDRTYLAFADTAYRHALTFCSREVGFAPEYVYGR